MGSPRQGSARSLRSASHGLSDQPGDIVADRALLPSRCLSQLLGHFDRHSYQDRFPLTPPLGTSTRHLGTTGLAHTMILYQVPSGTAKARPAPARDSGSASERNRPRAGAIQTTDHTWHMPLFELSEPSGLEAVVPTTFAAGAHLA